MGSISRVQRVVLVVCLMVFGWQVFAVTTPLGGGCSAAVIDAFRGQTGTTAVGSPLASQVEAAREFQRRLDVARGRTEPPCRAQARNRLWRAGVVATLALLVTAAAVRVLAEPRARGEEAA